MHSLSALLAPSPPLQQKTGRCFKCQLSLSHSFGRIYKKRAPALRAGSDESSSSVSKGTLDSLSRLLGSPESNEAEQGKPGKAHSRLKKTPADCSTAVT